MGSFFSLLQGALFAVVNTAALAFLLQTFVAPHVGTELAPRILVLFAGATFLLGTTMMTSLASYRDPATGALVSGGMGMMLAALVALYAAALVAVVAKELVLMVLPLLFALYVFASILARTPSQFAAPLVALFVLVVALVAFSDLAFADPAASSFSRFFDLGESSRAPGYLEAPGSFFAEPMAAPVVVTVAAFLLVHVHQSLAISQSISQ